MLLGNTYIQQTAAAAVVWIVTHVTPHSSEQKQALRNDSNNGCEQATIQFHSETFFVNIFYIFLVYFCVPN